MGRIIDKLPQAPPEAKPPRTVVKRSVWEKPFIDEFCAVLVKTGSFKGTCARFQVNHVTFFEHYNAGRDETDPDPRDLYLYEQVEVANAEWEARQLRYIEEASAKDWKAAWARLRARWPEQYGDPQHRVTTETVITDKGDRTEVKQKRTLLLKALSEAKGLKDITGDDIPEDGYPDSHPDGISEES